MLRQTAAVTSQTHRFNPRQHANITSKVSGLKDSLVVSPKVQVDHQGLQLLTDDPGLVFRIPAVKSHQIPFMTGGLFVFCNHS